MDIRLAVGKSFMDGDFLVTIIFVIVIVVLATIGIVFRKQITEFLEKEHLNLRRLTIKKMIKTSFLFDSNMI